MSVSPFSISERRAEVVKSGGQYIDIILLLINEEAPVAQWVKRWPTDLADRVRFSLEMKSSQP